MQYLLSQVSRYLTKIIIKLLLLNNFNINLFDLIVSYMYLTVLHYMVLRNLVYDVRGSHVGSYV